MFEYVKLFGGYVGEICGRWLDGGDPHDAPATIELIAHFPTADAYHCLSCGALSYHAPKGACRRCGSVVVVSVVREFADLKARIASLTGALATARQESARRQERIHELEAERRQWTTTLRRKANARAVNSGAEIIDLSAARRS